MGKPNKRSKWLKAVKKVFRSPSKDKSDDADEPKNSTKESHRSSLERSLAPNPVPTPLPLPSVQNVGFIGAEREQGKQPLAVEKNECQQGDEEKDNTEEVLQCTSSEQSEDELHEEDSSREEWAASKIQRTFHGHLRYKQLTKKFNSCGVYRVWGRRALRALKGLVRLQALVRGHTVRRQAAATLRAVEALVHVQALHRGRRVRMSEEGQAVQLHIMQCRQLSSHCTKAAEGSLDANKGTAQGFAITQRQEESDKLERAMSYSFIRKLKQSAPKRTVLFIDCEPDQPHWGWSWLDRWMASRPWENHYFLDIKDVSVSVPCDKLSGNSRKQVVQPHTDCQSSPHVPQSVRPSSTFRSITVAKSVPVPLPPPPCEGPLPVAKASLNTPHCLPKPLPLQVSLASPKQEDSELVHLSPEEPVSPVSDDSLPVPPSPPYSDDSLPVPPSPPGSDNSLPVPPSPPVPSSPHTQWSAMLPGCPSPEDYVSKEVSSNGLTLVQSPSISAFNGAYIVGEEEGVDKAQGNKEFEAGHNNTLNHDKTGDNGNTSLQSSSKGTTSRYMAATESAKAKFRSLSSPKSRTIETVPSPAKQQTRLSLGGAQMGKPDPPGGTSHTQRSNSQVRTSLKGGLYKEKSFELGTQSPSRRNSLGGEASNNKPIVKWR